MGSICVYDQVELGHFEGMTMDLNMSSYSALFEKENRKDDEIVPFHALSAQIGSRCFTQYNSSLSELNFCK